MFCDFHKAGEIYVCSVCGTERSILLVRECTGEKSEIPRDDKPTPTAFCKHLGEKTEKFELIKCETCQGNVKVKYFVYECALHARCLPYASEDKSVRCCELCPDNTKGEQ